MKTYLAIAALALGVSALPIEPSSTFLQGGRILPTGSLCRPSSVHSSRFPTDVPASASNLHHHPTASFSHSDRPTFTRPTSLSTSTYSLALDRDHYRSHGTGSHIRSAFVSQTLLVRQAEVSDYVATPSDPIETGPTFSLPTITPFASFSGSDVRPSGRTRSAAPTFPAHDGRSGSARPGGFGSAAHTFSFHAPLASDHRSDLAAPTGSSDGFHPTFTGAAASDQSNQHGSSGQSASFTGFPISSDHPEATATGIRSFSAFVSRTFSDAGPTSTSA
ncbi:hypothetical protein BAUCODRAFT_266977 [Baudoinia panamericana UAMH 10762]|uniref:Uncharacterized protein n=1 Tax=Baudoinia panamericana (strain UAMH 10762) TaxID=717646 RepID=M2N1T9_BAUPA|nr:uncharacterized protein BAUCODRAFT_266977 [Baudoinia panamericana UAMH 10762]EMC92929.1 hypothetical protein BAUCODRAFT_266977 [Baudoinia panamericana UAMH 10762]